MVGGCLVILMSQGPGPPASVAAGALLAVGVSVAAGAVTTSGAAQPLHPLFQQCSHNKGPLMGIPHDGYHLLI